MKTLLQIFEENSLLNSPETENLTKKIDQIIEQEKTNNNMKTRMEKRVSLVFTIKRVQDAMNTKLEDRTSEQRQVLRRVWEILNHIGYHKVY
jgi:hypothetical protein